MSGAADRIQVDPDELDTLGYKIGRVQAELESSLSLFDGQGSDIGSHLIEGALDDFNAAWSQRRRDLIQLLHDSAAVLHNAADEFRQADANLANAIDGSGGTGTAAPATTGGTGTAAGAAAAGAAAGVSGSQNGTY